jgi:hypothetical protein
LRRWALRRNRRRTPTGLAGSAVTGVPSSLSSQRWLASDVYKASIYDNNDNKNGDVTDLVMDSNGNITTAVSLALARRTSPFPSRI